MTKRTLEIPEPEKSDGVYRVGNGTHAVKFLRIRGDLAGDYRRYTLDDGKTIVFERV